MVKWKVTGAMMEVTGKGVAREGHDRTRDLGKPCERNGKAGILRVAGGGDCVQRLR